MNLLTPEQWDAIRPIFIKEFPNEAVVAVWHDGTFTQLQNVSTEPRKHFVLTQDDRLALMEHSPLVLLHSHPEGKAEVSDLDSLNQVAFSFPWGIVAISTDGRGDIQNVAEPECWGADLPIPELQGRSYMWGVRDCFTLVRDYFRLKGEPFPNPPRIRNPSLWPNVPHATDQIRHYLREYGFQEIRSIDKREGDVFTQCWGKRGANVHDHCGIYMGNGQLLEQLSDRTSQLHIPHDPELYLSKLQTTFWRRT